MSEKLFDTGLALIAFSVLTMGVVGILDLFGYNIPYNLFLAISYILSVCLLSALISFLISFISYARASS